MYPASVSSSSTSSLERKSPSTVLPKPEQRDGLLLGAAGNVVVQIELGDGLLRAGASRGTW